MSEIEAHTLEPFEIDDDDSAPLRTKTAGPNVLEALKAHRARTAQAHTYDLVVPGWGDLLVLRLGAITAEQQQRLIDRAQRRKIGSGAHDLLISAFREVCGRATPTGELATLVDADGDPVGLDERLADLLDLGPVRSARDVVDRLFSRANAPLIALESQIAEYVEWCRGANEEIDETFLGE